MKGVLFLGVVMMERGRGGSKEKGRERKGIEVLGSQSTSVEARFSVSEGCGIVER